MTEHLSLRERKKQATREALSHAAWRLMLERGLSAVTPEAVAEAAEVSPRTFRNYFASREEAIIDGLVQRGGGSIPDEIRARPAGEPLWDSFMQVLPTAVTQLVGAREDLHLLMQVVNESPAMFAQHLVVFERSHTILTELIAERTGTDIRRDLAPRLLAAAVGMALRTSVEIWAEGDVDATLPDLIRQSLAQLRAGLPLGAEPITR